MINCIPRPFREMLQAAHAIDNEDIAVAQAKMGAALFILRNEGEPSGPASQPAQQAWYEKLANRICNTTAALTEKGAAQALSNETKIVKAVTRLALAILFILGGLACFKAGATALTLMGIAGAAISLPATLTAIGLAGIAWGVKTAIAGIFAHSLHLLLAGGGAAAAGYFLLEKHDVTVEQLSPPTGSVLSRKPSEMMQLAQSLGLPTGRPVGYAESLRFDKGGAYLRLGIEYLQGRPST
jgi:hypothetical protein